MANADLTPELLREMMDYNPATGIFTKTKKSTYPGYRDKIIGRKNAQGYVTCTIGGKVQRMHRLAWLHFYGVWPKDQIDHIDGNKSNNAISNLRDVTNAINGQNVRKANKDSISGLLGVCKAPRGKWIASISTGGVSKYIGIFDSPKLAHEAYLVAKRKLHIGCTI